MRKISTITLMIFGLLLAITAVAKDAKEKKYEVELANAVEANGVQLKAGTYKVAVEDNSLIFYQGNKEVAKVPGHMEETEAKNQETSVTVSNNKLTEIRLSGTNMRFVVGG